MDKNEKINWDELGFDYIKTDYRYISTWKDGNWDEGKLTKDNMLTISEVLHSSTLWATIL